MSNLIDLFTKSELLSEQNAKGKKLLAKLYEAMDYPRIEVTWEEKYVPAHVPCFVVFLVKLFVFLPGSEHTDATQAKY